MGVARGARRLAVAQLATALFCLLAAVSAAAAAPQASGTAPDRTPPAARANCAWLSEAERGRTPYCHASTLARDASARAPGQAIEPSGFKFSMFLKYLHTDVLWTPSETGAGVQGLVGVHLVVANIGRIHVFGPPGVMLITQKTSTGKIVRAASTWGTSIYLIDVRLPGSRQSARLFANFGKVWTSGDHRTGINMIGLSATWKK